MCNESRNLPVWHSCQINIFRMAVQLHPPHSLATVKKVQNKTPRSVRNQFHCTKLNDLTGTCSNLALIRNANNSQAINGQVNNLLLPHLCFIWESKFTNPSALIDWPNNPMYWSGPQGLLTFLRSEHWESSLSYFNGDSPQKRKKVSHEKTPWPLRVLKKATWNWGNIPCVIRLIQTHFCIKIKRASTNFPGWIFAWPPDGQRFQSLPEMGSAWRASRVVGSIKYLWKWTRESKESGIFIDPALWRSTTWIISRDFCHRCVKYIFSAH